jgi:UDP-N-acetylglucosamine:LPS N-acetylglucosamine transferase
MKLLILSSDTGEGHNSAAAAIQEAARSVGFQAKTRKPLEESTKANRLLAGLYNTLLTNRPQWMSWYFRFIDGMRPNERDCFYFKLRSYIRRFITAESPDVLLSVHPMLNHFIPRFIKEEGFRIPCFALLTDPFPPFWRGWASPYIDQYFVPTDDARLALTACGISSAQIECISMPVRPQFVPATMREIQTLRNALELGDQSIILINGGARGGGPIFEIYKSIRKAAVGANLLVVCGKNDQLRRRIEAVRDSNARTFGFLEDIHRYVAASDLVITKPGALSTYEALACRVPVLLTSLRCLMPQESGLFRAARHYDFGFCATTFAELESIVRKGPSEWNRKRESIAHFYTPSSLSPLIERMQLENVQP